MIDVFQEPVTQASEGPEITITLNGHFQKVPDRSTLLYGGFDDLVDAMAFACASISAEPLSITNAPNAGIVATSFGETAFPDETIDNLILWGCQVGGGILPGNMNARCVSGPISARTCHCPASGFCDARILLPYVYGLKHEPAGNTVLLIPGPSDEERIRGFRDKLGDSGFQVLDKSEWRGWRHACTKIATSRLVVTSSITAYIVSEAMGVPVWPFIYASGNFPDLLSDYVNGTLRPLPEILDFSRKVNINRMPDQPRPSYNIDFLLGTAPFEIRDPQAIKEYFNAA